jgi:protein AaeX
MFTEAQFGGIFFAPIVIYCVISVVIVSVVRFVLGRTGLFARVWHPALFELALYMIITGAVIYLTA